MKQGSAPISLISGRSTVQTLQPPFFLEDVKRQDGGEGYQHERHWIPELPVQFGQEPEVHAVDAGDEGGRQKDYRHDGKYLDDLVLLHAHMVEEEILQVVETFEVEIGGGDE